MTASIRKSKTWVLVAVAAIWWALGSLPAQAALMVDANLPSYKATSGVSGNVKSVGSDTLNNLMTLWAEGFKSAYPDVKIEIEGKGSSTALDKPMCPAWACPCAFFIGSRRWRRMCAWDHNGSLGTADRLRRPS